MPDSLYYEVKLQCEVCDTEFNIEKYGRGVCLVCGQGYEWEEGYVIVLTEKQKELLLFNKSKQKRLKAIDNA